MNGTRIHLYREFTNYAMFHSGRTVQFVVERDGEQLEFTVEPVLTDNGYKYGISGTSSYREKAGVFQSLQYGVYEVKYWIDTTLGSLKMLVSGGVTLDDMSGPVGVVEVIGDTYEESKSDGAYYVWLNLINIAVLLSANLGVMNLLPIPALDGGRLVFLIIEAIRRRRLDPEIESRIHLAGLMALMLLMVVVMANDIKKLFL
jgi:regulator of sigma E protease